MERSCRPLAINDFPWSFRALPWAARCVPDASRGVVMRLDPEAGQGLWPDPGSAGADVRSPIPCAACTLASTTTLLLRQAKIPRMEMWGSTRSCTYLICNGWISMAGSQSCPVPLTFGGAVHRRRACSSTTRTDELKTEDSNKYVAMDVLFPTDARRTRVPGVLC